ISKVDAAGWSVPLRFAKNICQELLIISLGAGHTGFWAVLWELPSDSWDLVSWLQTFNANWIIMTLLLPPDISSVKAQRTTAISHTDFLMRRPSAKCTDVISGMSSPDVNISN
ncbi:hypothetical protein ABVT39_026357, partial [Epinephelus coioides]